MVIILYLSDSLKEFIYDFIVMINFAIIGVVVERIFDSQFDKITLILGVLAVCFSSLFFWLTKKYIYKENNTKNVKSLNNKKRKKKNQIT